MVCYTDDGKTMPCPGPVLLKVSAVMARLMGCVPLEQKVVERMADVGKGDDDNVQERDNHKGPDDRDQNNNGHNRGRMKGVERGQSKRDQRASTMPQLGHLLPNKHDITMQHHLSPLSIPL